MRKTPFADIALGNGLLLVTYISTAEGLFALLPSAVWGLTLDLLGGDHEEVLKDEPPRAAMAGVYIEKASSNEGDKSIGDVVFRKHFSPRALARPLAVEPFRCPGAVLVLPRDRHGLNTRLADLLKGRKMV